MRLTGRMVMAVGLARVGSVAFGDATPWIPARPLAGMQTSTAGAANLRLPADEFGRRRAGGGGLGEAALDRPSGEAGDEKGGDEGVAGAGAVLDLGRRRGDAPTLCSGEGLATRRAALDDDERVMRGEAARPALADRRFRRAPPLPLRWGRASSRRASRRGSSLGLLRAGIRPRRGRRRPGGRRRARSGP